MILHNNTVRYIMYRTVQYIMYSTNITVKAASLKIKLIVDEINWNFSFQNLGKMSFQYKELWQLQLFYQNFFLRSQFLLTLPIKIILPGFHCFWWLSIFSLQRVSKIDFENGVKSRDMEYGFQSQRSDHLDFKCNQHCIQKTFSRGQF